jgi:hypothetical protein
LSRGRRKCVEGCEESVDEGSRVKVCPDSGDTQFYEDLLEWRKCESDLEIYRWHSIGADEDEDVSDDEMTRWFGTRRLKGPETE